VVYRVLWQSFGLRYLPYELFALALYLAVAALVRVVMRRAGVGPWVATLTVSILVFFGAGIENNFFTGVLVFSLVHLLLADHEGEVDWRDGVGLLAGLLALMCSGLAVTTTIMVGLAMLLRRGWRIALLHTVPLGIIYVIWSVTAPPSHDTAFFHGPTLSSISRFVLYGTEEGFKRLGALTGFGIAIACALTLGLVLRWKSEGCGALRGEAALPVAMLAGAFIFLILTGTVRSGIGGFLFGSGPERARDPRYAYVIAAMVLPAVALAADALIRRWRFLSIVLALLLIATVPSRVHQFRDAARGFALAGPFNEALVMGAAKSPLAPALPRSDPVGAGVFGGRNVLTIGWLVDGVASGRISPPKSLSPVGVTNETLQLALAPTTRVRARTCWVLTQPTARVLEKGDLLTLQSGEAEVVYEPPSGVSSTPQRLARGTVQALAGPLKLRIASSSSPGSHPPIICDTTGA